jgi:hypothetical protein
MDISTELSLAVQANTLHAVRTTLAAARAEPPTPEAQADVIVQLSTAAQQLLQGGGAASRPTP